MSIDEKKKKLEDLKKKVTKLQGDICMTEKKKISQEVFNTDYPNIVQSLYDKELKLNEHLKVYKPVFEAEIKKSSGGYNICFSYLKITIAEEETEILITKKLHQDITKLSKNKEHETKFSQANQEKNGVILKDGRPLAFLSGYTLEIPMNDVDYCVISQDNDEKSSCEKDKLQITDISEKLGDSLQNIEDYFKRYTGKYVLKKFLNIKDHHIKFDKDNKEDNMIKHSERTLTYHLRTLFDELKSVKKLSKIQVFIISTIFSCKFSMIQMREFFRDKIRNFTSKKGTFILEVISRKIHDTVDQEYKSLEEYKGEDFNVKEWQKKGKQRGGKIVLFKLLSMKSEYIKNRKSQFYASFKHENYKTLKKELTKALKSWTKQFDPITEKEKKD
eukprot:gene6145-10152_t